MKITAQDLMRFGVIDEIVPEPVGGAHRDPAAAIAATGEAIAQRAGRPVGLDRRRRPAPAAREIPQYRQELVPTGPLTAVYLSFTIYRGAQAGVTGSAAALRLPHL